MTKAFSFGDCRLTPDHRELRWRDVVQRIEPQVFDLIVDLIEHRDRMVTRDELLERVWHGRIVSDATLGSRLKMVCGGDPGAAAAQQKLFLTPSMAALPLRRYRSRPGRGRRIVTERGARTHGTGAVAFRRAVAAG